MNFLAHNYLSFERPDIIVGNYLGDFLKNAEVSQLPFAVQQGVRVHRMIDSFTDVHKAVKSATKLLHPTLGKYAPVVIDIYFDYLLSKRWSDFSAVPLIEFCEISYDVLLAHRNIMSPRNANRLTRMVEDRWLENYQTYQGLEQTFMFLSRRAKYVSNLQNAPAILKPLESRLELIFMQFFPDAINYIRNELELTSS